MESSSIVKIRPLNGSDIEDIFRLYSNEQVMNYSLTGAMSRKQVQELIQKDIFNFKNLGFGRMHVSRVSDGTFLGAVGALSINVDGMPEVEIGYRILPEFWGSGYAVCAANLLIEQTHKVTRASSFISLIDPINKASIRVAEKLEMKFDKMTEKWGLKLAVFRKFNL